MTKQELEELRLFYEKHLFRDVLPFWTSRAIDYKYGGYYTCFTNSGEKLVSKDKYIWSQGRFIWLLSALAEHYEQYSNLIELAEMGVNFLKEKAFLENGNCVFLLSQDGKPKEFKSGQGYDVSIFADCFLVMGFARYAAVSKSKDVLDITWEVYNSINDRMKNGNYQTEPEPCPQGYRAHGISMIFLNISQELAKTLEKFNDNRSKLVRKRAHYSMEDIFSNFVTKDNYLFEFIGTSGQPDETMFSHCLNPGHSLEDMWFVIHQALWEENEGVISRAINIIENMINIGWDKEYGGLFHFVDEEGGQPKIRSSDDENNPLVRKIRGDWDNKLWWAHSEALYTTLLGYYVTGRKSLLELFYKIHDYTFSIFPNPDLVIGEWIQIRDRKGNPVEKVVALPVKDPFHIIRNLILIIKLLKTMIEGRGQESGKRIKGQRILY